jgi:hypothetical protein
MTMDVNERQTAIDNLLARRERIASRYARCWKRSEYADLDGESKLVWAGGDARWRQYQRELEEIDQRIAAYLTIP